MWNTSAAGACKDEELPRCPATKKERLSRPATGNNAAFNMTNPPKTRELARCLLTYEAESAGSSAMTESATLAVFEKLRKSLSEFAGAAAFQSLAFRALTQAKSETPSLWAVQVGDDGSLQDLNECGAKVSLDKDLAGEGGTILIARLLGLLHIFLGEALTSSLLRVTWPGAALDGCNSENGRKA
jgi:hypothetical protein